MRKDYASVTTYTRAPEPTSDTNPGAWWLPKCAVHNTVQPDCLDPTQFTSRQFEFPKASPCRRGQVHANEPLSIL